jgi:hypothetical protein
MAIYNVGERGIDIVRVVLASYGIFAANMTDIDAMGIPDFRTRRDILDTLMTGNPTMGERNTGLNHTASRWRAPSSPPRTARGG